MGKNFCFVGTQKPFDIFYNMGQNFCFGRMKKKFTDCYFIEKKNLHISLCVSIAKFSIFFIKWDRSVSFPILKLLNNNRFKTSVPKLNYNYVLSGGSYSISDIQGYFEYIIKKHDASLFNVIITITDNALIAKIKPK